MKIARYLLPLLLIVSLVVPFINPTPAHAVADRYFVMGQVFIVDGAHITVAEAGRNVADCTLNITDDGSTGTFTVYMASGTSGTIASGTTVITGSPVTLSAGSNTITAAGTGTAAFDITIGTAANWNTVNSWSAASGGACTASVPTSADSTFFNANSFTAASQILTVDATAYCLDMDWTGSLNTPTLQLNVVGAHLFTYGNVTFIGAMVVTGTRNIYSYASSGTQLWTNNAVTWSGVAIVKSTAGGTLQFVDATSCGVLQTISGTLNTNNQTITCTTFSVSGAAAKSIQLGTSVINCTDWDMETGGGAVTLTASAGCIIKVTGTGSFKGSSLTTYQEVQLNGTAHIVSGSNTFVNLTRTGTATKTDTLTLTSSTTQTVTGTCALIGNSAINRLLVQSSTLGTAATITAAAWTGTNGVDFMDITSTNAIDFSNEVTYSNFVGDCGGNTNITCTASSTQTSASTAAWSTAAGWTGSGTSRVPIAQDDVNCSHSKTVDMPRIGKSISFSGTPIITLSNNVENYGSFTLASGMAYTHSNNGNIFRGRVAGMPVGGWTINTAGKTPASVVIRAPLGTYKLLSDITITSSTYGIAVFAGFFNADTYNVNILAFEADGSLTREVHMGSGTWTLSSTGAGVDKWLVSATGLTLYADTSTIVLTNSTANGNVFGGATQTYNNVTVQGAGAYALTVSGDNVFNTFTVDRSAAAKTITLTAGSNQTVSSFVCATSGTNLLTINSTAGTATLTKSGGGVLIDYISLANNTGAPANTWYYGTNNTIGANVNGWGPAALPTVTTQAGTLVEATTATGNGTITALGGVVTTRGICYSTINNPPTTADSKVQEVGDWTNVAYTEALTPLNTGTTYYLRAYAINGTGTGYGAAVSILTKPAAPTALAATDGTDTAKVVVTWTKSFGATDYHVWRDAADLGAAGDVATIDDAGADAPVITPGTADATDGTSTTQVTISLSGESVANGTNHTYKVVASNATGDSADSNTDTGYRGHGTLTYQWQVSAADSDAAYGNIGGATADPYDYTSAPAPTITPGTGDATDGPSTTSVTLTVAGHTGNNGDGRYYKCVLSATGAADQDSVVNRGYRGVTTLTYAWQRSAADADGAFSALAGATTNPYDDLTGVATPDGRYYYCIVSMTGAVSQDTTHNRGYMAIAPTVTISAATAVEETTATVNGDITNLNGGGNATEEGFDYDTNSGAPYTWNQHSAGAFGVAAFHEDLTLLSKGTLYYTRAYATSPSGTGYSSETTFLTKPDEPTGATAVVNGSLAIKIEVVMGAGATGMMVRFRTDGVYPTGIADGTQAYYGTSNVFNHTGLTSGTTYNYSVWCYAAGGGLTSYSDLYDTADCTAMVTPSVSTGYAWKKSFTVTGSACGAQTNYQMKFTVHYGAGADSGTTVYLDSKCQTDFDDLRFTSTDGVTVLDSWLESKTDSNVAYVWVELDTIPVTPGTQTFYLFYGKPAAVAAWNGPGTFVVFDDFERGTNGDTVGGSWTEVTADTNISTAHDIGDVAGYSGTRSLELVGGGAAPACTIPVTAGVNNYAYQYRYYKEDAAGFYTKRGNGTYLIDAYFEPDEDVTVYDGASYVDTTLNCSADAWGLAEYDSIIWNTTMTVTVDTTPKTLVDISYADVNYADLIDLTGFNNAGDDTWIDNFFVRKHCTPEPTITAWGAPTAVVVSMSIQDVKVITGYRETDDWMVLVRYINTYAPYYDTYDVKKYFVLQLLDSVGAVKAQTVLPEWGNRVGSIYLSAANTSALTYGGSYTVRMYGTFVTNPYVDYTVVGADWLGADLANLDSWVRSSATVMATYYSTTMTTYIAERGEVLNATGAGVFSDGIAGLSQVRPAIFQTYSVPSTYTPGTITQSYRQSLDTWQTNIGPDGTVMLTRVGNIVGIGGDIIAVIAFLIMMFILMALAFPAGHTTAAMVLSLPMLGGAIYFGMDLLYIGMLALVAAFLFIKNFWLDKGN